MELVFDFDPYPREGSLRDITIFLPTCILLIFKNITEYSLQTIHRKHCRHYCSVFHLLHPVTEFSVLWHVFWILASLTLGWWSRPEINETKFHLSKSLYFFKTLLIPISIPFLLIPSKASFLSCKTWTSHSRIPPSAPTSQPQSWCTQLFSLSSIRVLNPWVAAPQGWGIKCELFRRPSAVITPERVTSSKWKWHCEDIWENNS